MAKRTWRVGGKLGRTLYKNGACVGMVDSPELATEIVRALNGLWHCTMCGADHERGKTHSESVVRARTK